MKPKPTAHKNENTFKFESFNERIQKINLSTVNHLKRRFDADEQDDHLPFFTIALDKWHDLNCTQDYKDVCKKIGPLVGLQNLVQILHRKNELVHILIDGLKVKDSKALNALLELLVALARDLQSEFYQYFPEFFPLIVELTCQQTEVESIEALFVCQAFLFKYLWKFILKDIAQHYETIKQALLCKRTHVLNFTCEVFSFFIKKSKQPEVLIGMLFDSVLNQPDFSQGVSHVLFESIKGLDHSFHSKAQPLLDVIFKLYFRHPNNCLDQMMSNFIGCLVYYCTKQTFQLIWNYLLLDVEKFPAEYLIKSITLINQVVCFKNCKLVHDSSKILVNQVQYMNKLQSLEMGTRKILLQTIEYLFVHRDNDLSWEKVRYFCDYFYNTTTDSCQLSSQEILSFSLAACKSSLFDLVLNKYCCKYCYASMQLDKPTLTAECVHFLANVVLRKRLRPLYGAEIGSISKYSLPFEKCDAVEYILRNLLEFSLGSQTFLDSLIVIPHLASISDAGQICQLIQSKVYDQIELHFQEAKNDAKMLSWCSHILLELIVTLIILKAHKIAIEEIEIDRLIFLARSYSKNEQIMLSVDLFLTYNKSLLPQSFPQDVLLSNLFPVLLENLSSHSRMIRIVSLHICTLFDLSLESTENDHKSGKSIFEVCLDAELTPLELTQFRDRLKHIGKLDCNFVSAYMPAKPMNYELCFDSVPIYYMLGSLYANLSVLWKPTLEVLETYAHSDKHKKLYAEIMLKNLKQTTEMITSPQTEALNLYQDLFELSNEPNWVIDAVNQSPDHSNHRLLLLKSFENTPEVLERANSKPLTKDFLQLFFDFIFNESSTMFASLISDKENLQQIRNNSEQPQQQPMERDDIDIEEKEEENNDNKVNSFDMKIQWKTFYSYLSVLAKFKNPKALYRESDLLQMELNMLVSPNSTMQKHAMNCLFSYGHSYLNKYKENLLKLLDDKTFSSQIHLFIRHDNEEDNIVADEDRAKLMPVVLRIFYGKMLACGGTKLHGKSKIDFLRSIIFKVIASFEEIEQIQFLDLIFASFQPLLAKEPEQLLLSVEQFVDIQSFIPFKQFQSFITTLEYVMKHFGSKSPLVVRYMYKVLILCAAICTRLLHTDNRSQLESFTVGALKHFRANCFKVAQYFFTHFDSYAFTSFEIEWLFTALINPLVFTLDIDSHSTPSPLLRLFGLWCENPRYYVLLAKQLHSSSDQCLTPMEAIIRLYSHEKISPTTSAYITDMIVNLLTHESVKFLFDNENILPINIENGEKELPKASDYPNYPNSDKLTFGALLLIPNISKILATLNARKCSSNNNKKEFTLQEVNMLAHLSIFVTDPHDAAIFSTILLHSILPTRRPEEDKEVSTLKTLNHLAQCIEPNRLLDLFHLTFPLFGLVNRPLSRRELCNYVCTLTRNEEKLAPLTQLIANINAYDERMPEEPDYTKRIGAFKQILTMLQDKPMILSESAWLDFILLLLTNCAFCINNFDDLSLRDLSSRTIVQVCCLLQHCDEDIFKRYIMDLVFFKILSSGFAHEKESVRHDYIAIMLEVVPLFHARDKVIDQLNSLRNEQDEEADFWQNIKHIQLHRRARALNRLCYNVDLLSSLSGRVLVNFLIPLVNNFITDPVHYSKNESLFKAAVDTLATLMQYCPWSKYDSTLSHYINGLLANKLDAKMAIRVISALLEKFSFLKPEHVRQIENDLQAHELKQLLIEFNTGKGTKKNKKVQKKSKEGGKFNNNNNKNRNWPSQRNEKLQTHTQTRDSEPIVSKVSESMETDNDAVVVVVEEKEEENDQEKDITELDKIPEANQENLALHRRKIYDSLCKKLLPMLHKCLYQKSQIDYMYDSYQKEFPEDDEIQRIPIALAVVKLLKHIELNQKLFEANLTSIFLRLCHFLQSRADSIRETSRNTLVQIMLTIGPKYFNAIFYEMRSLLSRGYQRHVFIYTVYILMMNLTSQFTCGDLDRCMKDVIEVCHLELFGNLAEEKEVSHIVTKTKEAKKLKSYDIYEILARFVSENALTQLLNPLEQVLQQASSHTVMKKVQMALHKIGRGLIANRFITVHCMVNMIDHIFDTTQPQSNNTVESAKIESLSTKLPSKMDYLLISEKALRRVTQTSKINQSSHSHIMADFALTCYFNWLKTKRLVANDHSHCELLEPSVVKLTQYLHSNDTKVVSSAINCIHTLMLKFAELNSLKKQSQEISSQLFFLLHKYSGLNSENGELINRCFKTIASFLHTRSECKLSNDEIVVLLSYAEKDIEANSHNSTIYFLLKSIISRKMVSKQLHMLMEKMLVLAITTEVDLVRNHAIELSIKYLTEYPIESNRFKGKLMKLVRQLEYDNVKGRTAAITILKSVINCLSYDVLQPLMINLFAPIASRIVNEESQQCKKLISDTVVYMVCKLSASDRDTLFTTFVEPWLSCDHILVQQLASRLCTIFLNYEKRNFESRLGSCLPLIKQQLDPTRFQSSLTQPQSNYNNGDVVDESSLSSNSSELKNEDNLIFTHLTFVLKLLKQENSVQLLCKVKYYEDFNQILEYVLSSYLLHPHSWIRYLATQLFGQLFSLFTPDSLVYEKELYKNTFLFQNTEEILLEFGKKFCLLYRDIYSCPENISEQLVKNLVYLARVMITFEQNGDEQKRVSLRWLISKLLFEVKFEIKSHPDKVAKRMLLFKWIAAVVVQLGKERVEIYLPNLLPPLCRQQLSTLSGDVLGNSVDEGGGETGEELASLNKQVLQLIRNLVGSDRFIDHYNTARNQLSHKRLERRKQRAVQVVTQTNVTLLRKQRKRRAVNNNKNGLIKRKKKKFN